jgi:predicted MFS family arabinose efflux permease
MLLPKTSKDSGLFRNRFIQVIILSNVLLQIGIWVRNFGILLYVMDKTGNNPYYVSLISVAEFGPLFLFSFIGGTFADRWRPKLTMVLSDFLSAVSVFIVLLTIIFGSWHAVFFVTLVSSILSQFSQPSAMKLFKVHLTPEQLQSGMAIFQTVMSIFVIIGPLLGTFIYQRFGINLSIGIMGLAFLMSAGVLTFLPSQNGETHEKSTAQFWHDLAEGFRYVWRRKVLLVLGGIFVCAGLGVGIIQPLGIFIITERLGLPKDNLQWLMVASGSAMLIGGGIILGISKKIAPQKLLAFGLLVNAISIVVVGLSTNLIITLCFQFLSGLVMPCIQIGVSTLMLNMSEEAYVGRVNGVLNPLFIGAMVLTISIAGLLKAKFSLVTSYQISGFLFFLGMLLTIPLFKKIGSIKET